MDCMFYYAVAFNGDVSRWNTASVTSMANSNMFRDARDFKGIVAAWNTASATSMSRMFYYYAFAFNGVVAAWNTASVTSVERMFLNARSFNGVVSGWNTASVTSKSSMFSNEGLSWRRVQVEHCERDIHVLHVQLHGGLQR